MPALFATAAAAGRIGLRLTGAVAMGLLAAAILLVLGLTGREAALDRLPPPTPEDAQYARVFMLTMEHIGRQPDRSGELTGTVAQVNGLFRLLARSEGDIRLRARTEEGRLALDASARVPGLDRAGWINATALVPPYDGALRLEGLRVGRIELPPGAALVAVGWALDRWLGAGAGRSALEALPRLALAGQEVTVDLVLPAGADGLLSRNAVAQLYGRNMPARAQVAGVVTFLQAEARAGRLPRTGSYVPWLRAAIAHAARPDAGDPAEAMLAGFMALNYMCGSRHFVDALLPADDGARMPGPGDACNRTTLRDRVDLRRHFTTAATIKLMSARNAAVTAGEAKELFDTLNGGFDFTDVAANNSGIRLGMRLDGAEPAELRDLAERIATEDDLIVDLAGIPRLMGRAAFRTRYGDIDSADYRAVIAEIEARIDRLPIHADAATEG